MVCSNTDEMFSNTEKNVPHSSQKQKYCPIHDSLIPANHLTPFLCYVIRRKCFAVDGKADQKWQFLKLFLENWCVM